MTRLRQTLLLSVLTAVISILSAPSASAFGGQQGHPSKEKLFLALEQGKLLKRDLKLVVKKIRQQGVPYQLTATDEQELRRLGGYLGKEGLDTLVGAIRDNYRTAVRPNRAETTAAAVKKAAGQGEPTAEEMKEALLRGLEKKGAILIDKDTFRTNTPIAFMTFKIEKFEKLGCKPASYGVGFECTYMITLSHSFDSTDGTPSGEQPFEHWNLFLRMLGGGKANETVTRKFVRSSEGWIAFEN